MADEEQSTDGQKQTGEKPASSALIIIGYILAICGSVPGLGWGIYLMLAKDGDLLKYDSVSRTHGRRIALLSIAVIVLYIVANIVLSGL